MLDNCSASSCRALGLICALRNPCRLRTRPGRPARAPQTMPHPWAAPAGAPRLLLSLALLAALALPARSQLDDCMANSHLERCRDYTVPQAVLERDLSQVCAASALGGQTYTGWPSACSLWHECTAGRGTADACQPLALLQTACNDLMGEPAVCQQ